MIVILHKEEGASILKEEEVKTGGGFHERRI